MRTSWAALCAPSASRHVPRMLAGERARLRGRLLRETARYGRPLSDRTAARHRPAKLCKAASCTSGCWASIETRRAPMCMGRLLHAFMLHTTLGFCRRPSGSAIRSRVPIIRLSGISLLDFASGHRGEWCERQDRANLGPAVRLSSVWISTPVGENPVERAPNPAERTRLRMLPPA